MLRKLLRWLKSLFTRKPKPVTREWNWTRDDHYAFDFKPTKAYADQRQKARRNRSKKPSKAMKNLYKL